MLVGGVLTGLERAMGACRRLAEVRELAAVGERLIGPRAVVPVPIALLGPVPVQVLTMERSLAALSRYGWDRSGDQR